MKKIVLFTAVSVLAFAGCTSVPDYDEQNASYPTLTKEQINQNLQEIFGTTFNPNQDWSSTTNHTITIKANAPLNDIEKVLILSEPPVGNEYSRALNEIEVTNGQTVLLNYDAPADYSRLYAACINREGICYIKGFNVGQNTVDFSSTTRTNTRAGSFELPKATDLKIDNRSTDSFNKLRADNNWGSWAGSGWNDRFYCLNDGQEQKLIETVANFTAEEKADLEAIFSAYLDRNAEGLKKEQLINGRPDNLGKIKASKIFSMDNNYLTSDGTELTVTPVGMASYETREGCWLYYYYFNPAIMEGKSEAEQVSILKKLPKYKAMQSWRIGNKVGDGKTYGNDEIFREMVFHCPYYGDDEPIANKTTAVSYIIPKGYKIGFVQRMMKDNSYTKEKSGELYGDGRLNNEINLLPNHFTSSQLGANDPRQAIFSANGKTYITFEDGSDRQFSDMIIEVNGVEPVDELVEIYKGTYTICFEDRQNGDYDMNDVVIKVQRIDNTHIKYKLVACGAHDELYLRNIKGNVLNEYTEIHAMFNVSQTTFVNTQGGKYLDPIEEIIEVSPDFTIVNLDDLVYIHNATTGLDIKLSEKGDDPHAIIIPNDYLYPKEQICIKDAYTRFTDWGINPTTSNRDWFREYVEEKVYTE